MSASGIDSVTSLNAGGVQTQSANGGIQVSSLSGGVSTMSSSYGGITCYKKACSTDYYLDAPSTSYFTRTSTTGTIGLTCYKATGCASGYYHGGTEHNYHGYYCSKNTCTSEGYVSSCSTGQVGTSVQVKSGSSYITCYKDCKDSEKLYYVRVEVRSNGTNRWKFTITLNENGGINPMSSWPFSKWSYLTVYFYCGTSSINSTINYKLSETKQESTFSSGGSQYLGCDEGHVTITGVYPPGDAFNNLIEDAYNGYKIKPVATGN